ncbi:MAG: SDR family oxidoreductase [Bacteroidetes bacterium]|jgi:short-subunit dehydrogenase|nr:SDR family oxidoreductase [Bacteroidota bacterium]MBT4401510.1 SDR family oxidoreductase [Bacteroidota bacterium]MBT4411150.1 SDR family oxidoreductase [Bacteroidota bacterium]MBT5426211.1 SDR family oxidoreductase [Bacteroidota bacterium]MBT7093218.1 SDR family oxidoreductase [Bacteroidota bacterium]
MEQFRDKVVWITGASAGIGEAFAMAAAKQGAKLILSARRVNELERVAKNCDLPAESFLILPMDMTESAEYAAMAKKVFLRFGSIDYLFNNAGVSSRALALETPIDVDVRIMNINYFGSIALSKAVLPYMIKQNSGHLIITSSVSGRFSTPMRSAYAASKHALHGFYNALRAEVYNNNIGVTILCPGYIRTDISVNALTASGQKFNKMSIKQANGMDPEVFTRKVFRAVKKRRQQALFGGTELMGVYLSKFAPGLLTRILRKMQDKDSFTQ